MKSRTSVFDSPPAGRRPLSILALTALVVLLALFASGVACHLLDPDHDWPQAGASHRVEASDPS